MLLGERADDLEHLARELGVERGGRLVEKQDLGVHLQRAGDGHALLLAAGELARIGVGLVAEAHLLERLARGRLDLRAVALLHADGRIHNVFEYRVVREEIELLKNEAEIVADLLELRLVGVDGGAVVARARGVVPVKADLAGVDALEQRGAAQQRGFAAAARADDGHDLALFDA